MRATILLAVLLPCVSLAGLTVLKDDSAGVVFRYDAGDIRLVDSGAGLPSVEMDDAEHVANPGDLDLPGRDVLLGLPQSGGMKLSIQHSAEQRLSVDRVPIVPWMSYEPVSVRYATLDEAASRQPAGWAAIDSAEAMGGVRTAAVHLRPVRYDPATRALVWVRSMEVRVEFESPARRSRATSPLDGALARMLINGGSAVAWKLDNPAPVSNPYAGHDQWLKILVDSTGVYQLTGAMLADAGVPISGLDPRTLALYTAGEHEPNRSYPGALTSVPAIVEGEEDGRLDRNDRLLFYGLGASHWRGRATDYFTNYFTRYNVYWLAWGGERGTRMTGGLAPDTAGTVILRTGREVLRLEQDADCPARSGLLWIWSQVFKPADRPLATFEAGMGLQSPALLRSLTGSLIADSAGNELSVLINRRQIRSFGFNQAPPGAPFRFQIDTALPMNATANTVSLELTGSGNKRIYVDYFEVDYTKMLSLASGSLRFLQDDTGTFRFRISDARERPLVIDVTYPEAPRVCSLLCWQGDSAVFARRVARPAEFFACGRRAPRMPAAMRLRRPGGLVAGAGQADYWIVTPEEFRAPAEQLARYRTGNIAGLVRGRADVALLEDVYDDYSFGIAEPGAIKRFFADKRPTYGLLAGDAICDYRRILGRSVTGVPAYEYGFGLSPDALDRTALAYDAWYADFDGEGGSPDMILARVTVRDAGEFARFVGKVAAYERDPVGFWNKRFILLADDEFDGDEGRPDPIGFNHIFQCEAMAVLPDNLLEPVKVYLTEYPYVGVKNKPGAHAEFMRQVNRGALLLVFFGHGSGFDLTHESALNISQVRQIDNQGRLPFCFFGSCSVGRFEDTQFECIAEELVRMDGGAIGAVGATKATTSASNQVFARNLLTPLLAEPDSTIGMSFYQAWPTDRIYHLFGDPATVLRIPRRSGQQLTVTPGVLQPGAPFRVRAIVEPRTGRYSWTLFGPRRVRVYRSSRGEAAFTLPGLELARGSGELTEGQMQLAGVFPAGIPLDTFYVANGFYAPVVRSCRLAASVNGESTDVSVMRDTIAYTAEPAELRDSAGPDVAFQNEGRPVRDMDAVPSRFDLSVVIRDTSGVMLAPAEGNEPLFFVNDRRAAVDLTDILTPDEGSSTTARFVLPVELTGPVDSLTVSVSDNVLNQTVSTVRLKVSGSNLLRLDSALVYPNPAERGAFFTFRVTTPSSVRVKLYTLSGRLARDLGESAAIPGYNQVSWDGRDADGNLLANGVYLFTLTATSFNGSEPQTVTVRDRFIVLR